MLTDFNIIAKPAGSACNLQCIYCFYLEKEALYPATRNFEMPYEVLDLFIKQKIETSESKEVSFAWQGGEPTMLGLTYFENIVSLQKKYANGKPIANAFQTNGILLNDDWCEFFSKENFLVGISIDGPQYIHDKYRITRHGASTFDKVLHSIGLLKKHEVQFNTLTAVQRHNSYKAIEVYDFLKETGSGFMQFIPIVERVAGNLSGSSASLVSPSYRGDAWIANWSVEPAQYGHFLTSIFDKWVRNDVGKVFIQLFDVALEVWIGLPSSLCFYGKTCGNAPIIEHNGDIYSCDHYVYPENKLGNINEYSLHQLVYSSKQEIFGNAKSDQLPNHCRKCNVRFICNGECPKHRFMMTNEGEYGLNYLCRGYKQFFQHIDPYMKFMASELRMSRAPANVMHWIRERDMEIALLRPERNANCPCGSGLKYKKCCGRNS